MRWIIPLIVIAWIFGAWWYLAAPCSTVLHWAWTLKDVPVRCFNF